MEYGREMLRFDNVVNSRILEVGSYNVNGSLREWVRMLMMPSTPRYTGVDIQPGPGVDQVVSANDLVRHFGQAAFDLVISTEMLEHCQDWRGAVNNMKRVLKPGGLLLLTTRSWGFALHNEPDWWRFEVEDVLAIFGDFDVIDFRPDPGGSGGGPGVFLFARRQPHYAADPWSPLTQVKVRSIHTGERL